MAAQSYNYCDGCGAETKKLYRCAKVPLVVWSTAALAHVRMTKI